MLELSFLFLTTLCVQAGSYNYSDINLHPDHLPYFFNMYKDLASHCVKDNCPLKVLYYKMYVSLLTLKLVTVDNRRSFHTVFLVTIDNK